jgi:hypothetical protein
MFQFFWSCFHVYTGYSWSFDMVQGENLTFTNGFEVSSYIAGGFLFVLDVVYGLESGGGI